jgi:hypothetical protein
MAQNNLLKILLDGTAPKNLRMLVARGSAPLPVKEMLVLLVCLLKDPDPEVSSSAAKTMESWDKEDIVHCLQDGDCAPAVLEYFAGAETTDAVLQAIVANPAAPGKTIEELALSAPAQLLEKILDNRVRILEFPAILGHIKKNPYATPEIRRLVQEIEVEFFSNKKKDYAVEAPGETSDTPEQILMESSVPLEDLSLEGLPMDGDAREAEINKRISCLSVREKIKYALFGNREIRALLVRDTNREVARSVLHSPKLTESEIETIAAMRAVGEDILRDIGNSREWTRSYVVVQNLVRNPKTPPSISQRLLFRLRAQDLMQLSRDRSIPDAVRYNAARAMNQRKRPSR